MSAALPRNAFQQWNVPHTTDRYCRRKRKYLTQVATFLDAVCTQHSESPIALCALYFSYFDFQGYQTVSWWGPPRLTCQPEDALRAVRCRKGRRKREVAATTPAMRCRTDDESTFSALDLTDPKYRVSWTKNQKGTEIATKPDAQKYSGNKLMLPGLIIFLAGLGPSYGRERREEALSR